MIQRLFMPEQLWTLPSNRLEFSIQKMIMTGFTGRKTERVLCSDISHLYSDNHFNMDKKCRFGNHDHQCPGRRINAGSPSAHHIQRRMASPLKHFLCCLPFSY